MYLIYKMPLGALFTQILVPSVRERTILSSFLLLQGVLACLVQFLGVGSAAVFFISGLPTFIALLLDSVLPGKNRPVSLLSYAIAQLMPLTCGGQLTYAMLDVFVPLVRVGPPSLHIDVLTFL